MEQTTPKHQEVISLDHDTLRFAEHFTSTTTIVERSTEKHYSFRKYLFLGNWGFCNAEKSRKIVDDKYSTVEVLVYAQLLVGRNADLSWDVFSLEGNFLMTTPSMSLSEVTHYLAQRLPL